MFFIQDLQFPVVPKEEAVDEKCKQQCDDDFRDDDIPEVEKEIRLSPDQKTKYINVEIIKELIQRAASDPITLYPEHITEDGD